MQPQWTPQAQPKPQAAPTKGRWGLFAAGLGLALLSLAALRAWWPAPGADAALDTQEQQALIEDFQAALPAALPQTKNALESDNAIATMQLPAEQAAALRRAVAAGLPLAWLELWDYEAADGDAVELAIGGFSRTLVLAAEPQFVAIPAPPGAPLRVTGVADGADIITAAIRTQSRTLKLPYFQAGTTVEVPLR